MIARDFHCAISKEIVWAFEGRGDMRAAVLQFCVLSDLSSRKTEYRATVQARDRLLMQKANATSTSCAKGDEDNMEKRKVFGFDAHMMTAE